MKKTYILDKPEPEVFHLLENLSSSTMFSPGSITTEFVSVSPPSFAIYMAPIFQARGVQDWGKTKMTVVLEKNDQKTTLTVDVGINRSYIVGILIAIITFIASFFWPTKMNVGQWGSIIIVISFCIVINVEKRRLVKGLERYLFFHSPETGAKLI